MSKTVDDILHDMEPELKRLREMPERPSDRIPEILALLQDAWMRNPSLRLMQLLGNLLGDDPYHVEDTQVARELTEYIRNN